MFRSVRRVCVYYHPIVHSNIRSSFYHMFLLSPVPRYTQFQLFLKPRDTPLTRVVTNTLLIKPVFYHGYSRLKQLKKALFQCVSYALGDDSNNAAAAGNNAEAGPQQHPRKQKTMVVAVKKPKTISKMDQALKELLAML